MICILWKLLLLGRDFWTLKLQSILETDLGAANSCFPEKAWPIIAMLVKTGGAVWAGCPEGLWMPMPAIGNKGRLGVRKLNVTNLAATWVKDRLYKEFSLLRMWINAKVTKQNEHLTQINFSWVSVSALLWSVLVYYKTFKYLWKFSPISLLEIELWS